MGKFIFSAISVTVAILSFTSCEETNINSSTSEVESSNTVTTAPSAKFIDDRSPISLSSPLNSSAKTIGLPSSIKELRQEGIEVPEGLARFVRNQIGSLLKAAALSETDASSLIELGFYPSEIGILKNINSKYNELVKNALGQ